MSDEAKKLFGELAILLLGISFAIARVILAAYACVMAAGAFGYSVTMEQVFIALVAIAVVNIKEPSKDKSQAVEATLRSEFIKLIAAAIPTFIIWCLV